MTEQGTDRYGAEARIDERILQGAVCAYQGRKG